LLGKWRWRIIYEGVGLRRDIILVRYPHLGGRLGDIKRVSRWWRNVSLPDDSEDAISYWFSEGVTKNVA
jgi:hypothetical protein